MSQNPRALPEASGVVQALEARELTLADSLGKYRLLGALGHGGMADVYLAVADGPEGFRKLCVLKLLKEGFADDDEFRAMFLDEARLTARLNHPNVVQTFEVGETHGRMMIAMEYVEGQPANRARRRLTPEQFPLTAYVSVLCDVLDALDYAHGLTDFDGSKLGIVHRDVTPHNIIIGYDGRVKLLDFGIAKSSAAMQETQAGVLKGKVGYMAPEQASMRALDGRADVFSVGVILWEAIAGRRLAEGQTAQDVLLRRVEGKEPRIADIVPNVDPDLAAICDRALSRNPDHRQSSAAELQADLEGWLKDKPTNRKELARSMREAFAQERAQLKTVVEQRMADSSMSGMRQALLGTSGASPSVSRLGGSLEGGTASHPAPVTGSGRQSTLPLGPSSGGARVSGVPLQPIESSLAARTVTVGPPGRRALPLLAMAAAGTCVLIGIASSVYVMRASSHPGANPASTAPLPAATDPAPPGATNVAPIPTETPSSLPSSPAQTANTNGNANARPRPAFIPPPPAVAGGRPAAPAHSNTPATTAAPPATNTVPSGLTPPPPKQPSRPLDEKDPYAP